MTAPFPWYGGKSRVGPLVWKRFGDIQHYIEPFAGSLAVLLSRPQMGKRETVNDLDCYLANFWRAISQDPVTVAKWVNWPINEVDLNSRHKWLRAQQSFRKKMSSDPDYFDPKIAGWWVWGISQWVGSGWCAVDETMYEQRPSLKSMGVFANGRRDIKREFTALADRLRFVRVFCGDWRRVLVPAVLGKDKPIGVLLDPPYSKEADRREGLYPTDDEDVAVQVKEWALEYGKLPWLKIALCGYAKEHKMPDDWEEIEWRSAVGTEDNSRQERVWFSPYCSKGYFKKLF